MKKVLLLLWLVALLTVCFTPALPAQSRFVHASGKELVAPDGTRLLLRGTNLGNWLEPEGYMFDFRDGPQAPREIEGLFNDLLGPVDAAKFWKQYRENYITEADIRFLRDAGFNSVRIPFHYKFFTAGNDEGFRLMDRVVGWAQQYGVYVILDMHCAPGGQTGSNIDDSWGWPWLWESPEDQTQTVEIWRRIAAHYRDNPTVLGYDLLNEPIASYAPLRKYNPELEPLYKRITAAVRQVDPNHVLIYGGAQWDSNFSVFGPPFDTDALYTFHKYWTPATDAAVAQYVAFRDKYNVPIWLGESGENTDEWIAQFVAVLERNGIGWSFWPYKKMEMTSAVVSFAKPVHWDAVVAFAALRRGTGSAEKEDAARPPLTDVSAAMQDLLLQIELAHCAVNAGYLRALGLHVPTTAVAQQAGHSR